jgi:signal transduction histidine kinase
VDGTSKSKAALLAELDQLRREKLNAEHALRENRELTEQVLEALPVGVFVIAPDGKTLYVNAHATSLLGEPPPPHTPLADISKIYGAFEAGTDEPYPTDKLPVIRSLGGEKVTIDDMVLRRGDREKYIEAWSSPVVDSKSRIYAAVAAFVDITQRRRAELQAADYQTQLRRLSMQLALAEERERHKLARDLHDGLGQTLAFLRIELAGLLRKAQSADQPALRQVDRLVREAEESVRSVTFQISLPILHDLGLVPAVEWLCEDLGKRHGLKIRLDCDHAPVDLDETMRVVCFRSIRELLLNVAKHAGTGSALVEIQRIDDRLRLVVQDQGRGFQFNETTPAEGRFGLFSIRERMLQLGGTMRVEAEPGRGTTVALELPLSPAHHPSRAPSIGKGP